MENLRDKLCNKEVTREECVSNPHTKPAKFSSRTIGVVIYAEPKFTEDWEEANKGEIFHIPISKEDVIEALKKHFEQLGFGTAKLILAHEHGELKKRCHFQCCITLTKKVDRTLAPFAMQFEGCRLLGMMQNAKNEKALWNYCKKEGDYCEYWNEKKKNYEFESVWDQLANDGSLDKDEIVELYKKNNAKDLLLWGEKIVSNYEAFVKQNTLPPFEWIFPTHIKALAEDENPDRTPTQIEESSKAKAIFKWFTEHCVEEIPRRKCLFLVSEERGLGKSEFAKRLVPHEDYYIYCRGSLDASEFKRKEKTAKLIILDDVSYLGPEKEMWKALVSGEKVNINTKYFNFQWKGGLPAIVITNEISTVLFWTGANAFKSQCCFVNVRYYMGPDGTRPKFLSEVDINFDRDFEVKLEEAKMKKQQRRKSL